MKENIRLSIMQFATGVVRCCMMHWFRKMLRLQATTYKNHDPIMLYAIHHHVGTSLPSYSLTTRQNMLTLIVALSCASVADYSMLILLVCFLCRARRLLLRLLCTLIAASKSAIQSLLEPSVEVVPDSSSILAVSFASSDSAMCVALS